MATKNPFSGMTGEELKLKEKELRQERFALQMQHATGQLQNTARLTGVKRDIARVLVAQKASETSKEAVKA